MIVIKCSAFISIPCSVRPAAASKKFDISFILERKSSAVVLRGVSKLPSPSKVAPFAVQNNDGENPVASSWNTNKSLGIVLLLSCYIVFNSPLFSAPAFAFEDYASDTVAAAVQNLNDAVGDKDKSFLALKNVAEIITDGKGVGGSLSYSGVQLERGLVADEDTSIYNPGLTLLSESEKQSLVDAVIQNRKSNMLQNSWSEDNQRGYAFLKQNLDPFHTVELKGYLKILPYYGAAVYLVTLFVQQNARQLFTAAYIAGVVAIFAPVIVLISNGP